jgi:uncharacterized protein
MKKYRWLVIIGVLLLLIGGGGYFGAGYVIYSDLAPVQASCSGEFLPSEVVDNTPADFRANYYGRTEIDAEPYLMPEYQDVEFSARGDDLTIRGWFVPNESEEVVILVHGLRSCRRNSEVLLPAGMLHRNGFNVLLIDMRNHGDSDIEDGRASAGNREYRDALGAYDWLLTQGFVSEKIGLIGVSLGGATSINAFAQEAGIAALWVDSTFADIGDVLSAELERNNYPTFFTSAGLTVSNLLGVNLTEFSPLESIGNNNNRPVFITHGTADERLSVDYAPQLLANAGDNAEMWIIEGMDHLQGMYVFPEEYEQNLIDFFGAALRDEESS